MRLVVLAFLVGLGTVSVAQAESRVVLKPGLGRDIVELHCSACHSLDYIVMNSPFLTPAQWRAEVIKMIDVFGAPIDPAEAARITDYLSNAYGG